MDVEGDLLAGEKVMNAVGGPQVQPSDRLAIAACHLAMAAKELPHAIEAQNMLRALSPDGAANSIRDALDSDVADPLPAQLLARATYQLTQAANQLPHALGAHQMLQALEPLAAEPHPNHNLDIDDVVDMLNEAADAAEAEDPQMQQTQAGMRQEQFPQDMSPVAPTTPLTASSLPPGVLFHSSELPQGIEANLPPPPALPPAVPTSHSPRQQQPQQQHPQQQQPQQQQPAAVPLMLPKIVVPSLPSLTAASEVRSAPSPSPAPSRLGDQLRNLESLKTQVYQHQQLQQQQAQIQQQVQMLQQQMRNLGVSPQQAAPFQSPQVSKPSRNGILTPPSRESLPMPTGGPTYSVVPPRLVAPDALVYERSLHGHPVVREIPEIQDDEESLPPDPSDREEMEFYGVPDAGYGRVSPLRARQVSASATGAGTCAGGVENMMTRVEQLEQDKLLLEHLVAQHRRINSLPASAINNQMLQAMMTQIESLKNRLLNAACNYAADGGDLTETAAVMSAHMSTRRATPSCTPQGYGYLAGL